METQLVLSFLMTSVMLALIPGPDNLFVLTESITNGKRNGIIISAGLASGIIIHTLVIAAGLSIIIQNSPYFLFGIKIIGALYLFYLAYLTYKEGAIDATPTKSDHNEKLGMLTLYKKGFLMNVLNPKVTLFFIAFLPQFVTNNGYDFPVQIVVLGIIFMLQSFFVFSFISIVAGEFRQLLKSKLFWKNVQWIKMCILIILGGGIILLE